MNQYEWLRVRDNARTHDLKRWKVSLKPDLLTKHIVINEKKRKYNKMQGALGKGISSIDVLLERKIYEYFQDFMVAKLVG